jgi:hypothetical protein
VVDEHTVIHVEVTDAEHRPVRIETTFEQTPLVGELRISSDDGSSLTLLVDHQ